uniref:Uncharacterized protein n=1 Tax=Helianthus annuus TaxID=4232 RepID=A0A251TTH8_HELAN
MVFSSKNQVRSCQTSWSYPIKYLCRNPSLIFSVRRLSNRIRNFDSPQVSGTCENKRTTYKSMKFSRFKKLGLGFDILFEG